MSSRRSARISALAEAKPANNELPTPAPAAKARKRKASPPPAETAPPSTPKRRAQKSTPVVPSTPTATPSAVRLIAEPAATPSGSQTPTTSSAARTTTTTTTPKPKSRAVARLADPNSTNAPLLSPETSRVISKSLGGDIPIKQPTFTTANILEDACAHLIKVNPRLKPLIEAHHCRVFSAEGLAEKIDPFESLVSGIISQQVSGAAAKAIKTRFIALFNHDNHTGTDTDTDTVAGEDSTATTTAAPRRRFPTPSQVAAASIETLRGAGLSQRKAEYTQGLAAKFAAGELTAQWLADAPYEDVLGRLIAVRGLGRWSVEMFACFGLKRMDVFSTGDLGVQRGMAAFAGRDVARLKAKGGGNKWKYMGEAEMVEMAAPFSPYRSLFMWYMWRVEETDISTLE